MSQIKNLDLKVLDQVLQKIPALPDEGLSGIEDIAIRIGALEKGNALTRETIDTVIQFIDSLKTIIFAFVDECNRENLHRFPLGTYIALTGDRTFAEEMTHLYESREYIQEYLPDEEYNELDLFSRKLNELNGF